MEPQRPLNPASSTRMATHPPTHSPVTFYLPSSALALFRQGLRHLRCAPLQQFMGCWGWNPSLIHAG